MDGREGQALVSVAVMSQNPLFAERAPWALPAYAAIRPEHADPAIEAVLSENRAALENLRAAVSVPTREVTWETLVVPLEDAGERLARVWGPILAPLQRREHGRMAKCIHGVPSESHGVRHGPCARRCAIRSLRAASGEPVFRAADSEPPEDNRRRASRFPIVGNRSAG